MLENFTAFFITGLKDGLGVQFIVKTMIAAISFSTKK
jgi:hypothetical protein